MGKDAQVNLRAAAAALALGLAALGTSVSAESLYAPHGARGDFGGELRCPANTYVVGFEGGTGQIIDRIAILCAPINEKGFAEAISFKSQSLGGGGGAPNAMGCPPRMIITSGIVSLNDARRQVSQLYVSCTTIGTGEVARRVLSGTGDGEDFQDALRYLNPFRDTSSFSRNFNCKPGEAMTGLTVRHGEHVNALGLICNELIKPKPVVVAAVPCRQGEVWRERFDGDTVCVHPDYRWVMADGSCRQGWVKLGAGPKKDTCGTTEKRAKAQADAAAAAAAVAKDKVQSGNPQDFAGTWNTTRRGENLILTLRVDGTNVTGEFTNPARPSSNGTLTGTVRTYEGNFGPIVKLSYVTTQPVEADGSFDVFTDGRLEGGFTWRELGKAKKTFVRWNGTRASD